MAGALGRYLRGHGYATQGVELRAMVPISVRGADEHGALGNRVSSYMAPLPVWCDDPLERLGLVSRTMGDLKQSKQAVGATLMTELADFAPPTIAGQAARLQSRQRFFNLVVTNIPGPQMPLYLLGRELEAIFPMVPLAKRQAVCFGIMSYNGQVNFGLIGDFDAVGDLEALASDLEASLAELAEVTPPVAERGQRATGPGPPAGQDLGPRGAAPERRGYSALESARPARRTRRGVPNRFLNPRADGDFCRPAMYCARPINARRRAWRGRAAGEAQQPAETVRRRCCAAERRRKDAN